MSSIVYFLNNFNNYYNRIIKKYDSVSDYINEIGEENYAVRGDGTTVIPGNKGPVNFNINDGVNAMLTYNYDQNQDWQPNYILVCDMEHTIKSRWFVIEAKRTRQGQYKLNLHRDVIADNYEATMQSVSLIENATLDRHSKYIFNSEGNTYNQIKQSETLLKDKTGCGWCIGFATKKENVPEGTSTKISAKISSELTGGSYNMTSSEFKQTYGSFIIYNPDDIGVGFYANGQTFYNQIMENWFNYGGSGIYDITWTAKRGNIYYREKSSSSDIKSHMKEQMDNILTAAKNMWSTFYKDYTRLSSIPNYYSQLDGQFIRLTDGIFKVEYVPQTNNNTRYITDLGDATDFMTIFDTAIDGYYSKWSVYKDNGYDKILTQCDTRKYDLVLTDYTEGQCTTNISNTMSSLDDAPYYMFAIPYGKINILGLDSKTYTTEKALAINTAIAIKEQSLYMKVSDIQLVPYCPCSEYWNNNQLDLSLIPSNNFQIIHDDDYSLYNVVIWCTSSRGSFKITHNIDVPDDAIKFKIENETTFYRLNSPNYNGVYEFKATMNNGVQNFDIDWWYKPGQPYIHINPNFNNMYGYDSNDARGLICQGDFTLPTIVDQWVEYVKNNMNYQNSFNRSIQNQETNRKVERINQAVGIASNAIAGGLGGAQSGGGAGAAAGAILGAAGGVADMALSEYSYKEQISYATDQFNYQLANVKALGDSITNVGAYNNNNKIFPFLEKWSCTDEEKNALELKLQYNGMTVGVIDYIQNYLRDEESFIRAKLIRFSDTGDMHLVATIAEELHKGVYLKK